MILTILIISISVVVLMLLHKMWEIRGNTKTFITTTFMRGDHVMLTLYVKLNRIFHRKKEHTIFFFLVHMPSRIEEFFINLKERSHGKYHSLSEKMRGKRNLKKSSAASPFMRTLTGRGSDNAGRIM